MQEGKGFGSLFPGSVATSFIVLTLGVILVVISLIQEPKSTVGSLLAGLGSAMFLAGFLGLVNVKVLANEIGKITSQPFEEIAFLSKIRKSGIYDVFRSRADSLRAVIPDVEEETNEVVLVGSSLKGLIGVGYTAVGQAQRMREVLISALKRKIQVNILMTNPEVAHHRSQQEGRVDGDIEAEILENLMYLVKLKHDNPEMASKLTVKLYNGTPTIFMVATSRLMMINPYPYYSTAYGSFSFLIEEGSDLYRAYYPSHYSAAWTDPRLTVLVCEDINAAIDQIKELIQKNTPHGRKIIPDDNKRSDLLKKLAQVRS